MRSFLYPVLLASLLLACSSTSSGTGSSGLVSIDTGKVCGKYVDECKQPLAKADCERTFGVLRVTPDCNAKFDSSTCTELGTEDSAVDQACFPDCQSPSTQSCNGDGTITICSSQNRTLIADCAATCQSVGKTFSGTCDVSFQGQTAEDGKAKCWCQ